MIILTCHLKFETKNYFSRITLTYTLIFVTVILKCGCVFELPRELMNTDLGAPP